MIRKSAIKTQTQHGKQTHNAEWVREKKKEENIFILFRVDSRSVSHPRAAADSAGTHTQNGMKPIMKRYCESKETFPIQNVLPSSPGPPTHTNIYSEKQKKERNSTNLFLSIKSFSKLNFVFPFRFLPRFTPTNLNSKMIIFPLRLPLSCRWQWGDLLGCREEKRKIPRRKTFLLLILFFSSFPKAIKRIYCLQFHFPSLLTLLHRQSRYICMDRCMADEKEDGKAESEPNGAKQRLFFRTFDIVCVIHTTFPMFYSTPYHSDKEYFMLAFFFASFPLSSCIQTCSFVINIILQPPSHAHTQFFSHLLRYLPVPFQQSLPTFREKSLYHESESKEWSASREEVSCASGRAIAHVIKIKKIRNKFSPVMAAVRWKKLPAWDSFDCCCAEFPFRSEILKFVGAIRKEIISIGRNKRFSPFPYRFLFRL